MNTSTARRVRHLRVIVLTVMFAAFVLLFSLAGNPRVPRWVSRGVFFGLDPFILLQHLAATKRILPYALLALIPLALTFVFGRFFCGWICPFGAIHEFISWLAGTGHNRSTDIDRSKLRLKYLILLFLLIAAVAGTALGGWLDPFALLTRSAAGAVDPSISVLLLHSHSIARIAAGPVLIGSIFLAVILLNAWKRRFFCNALCPLGALYGLASRFSLMRMEASSDCSECHACQSRCFYGDGPGKTYMKSECVACLACVETCPRESVQISFGWPSNTNRSNLDLRRRQLLGSASLALAFAALPKAALQAEPRAKARHSFLRPPGAVKEETFLARCARCGQCVKSCPTSFIQPAEFEAGLTGMWTPVLNAQAGYCEYGCNLCTKACPTGAIEQLTLPRKQAFKLGTATVDKSRCLTYTDESNCTVCVDKCPVPGKPLRFRQVDPQDSRGQLVSIRQVYVVPDLCTGCGICEHLCPRGGAPAITISSEDEDREAVTLI